MDYRRPLKQLLLFVIGLTLTIIGTAFFTDIKVVGLQQWLNEGASLTFSKFGFVVNEQILVGVGGVILTIGLVVVLYALIRSERFLQR